MSKIASNFGPYKQIGNRGYLGDGSVNFDRQIRIVSASINEAMMSSQFVKQPIENEVTFNGIYKG